ncbi:hypothetical protein [Lihuaxuella thermophila]|uniref:Uncharacterized protein n=1 Tax=Lihuaxuella thermophila TaxID=1173111 RepID=A0A1H8JK76_9BACL|nr:hypothetical protein [Lihuaxuella thermophila]SEN81163.1 hypothetical protein SAMN05444955_1285 [Lihuaxuella thermophila]
MSRLFKELRDRFGPEFKQGMRFVTIYLLLNLILQVLFFLILLHLLHEINLINSLMWIENNLTYISCAAFLVIIAKNFITKLDKKNKIPKKLEGTLFEKWILGPYDFISILFVCIFFLVLIWETLFTN